MWDLAIRMIAGCGLLLLACSHAASSAAAQTTAPRDCMRFIDDVTVPDDTHVKGGQVLEKTWRIANCGTTAWDGVHAAKLFGDFGWSALGPLEPDY